MMMCRALKMFHRILTKKKIASEIILILTSGFCFISKRKNKPVKNRNIKIVFLLLPLLPGFDLFISSLRLRLPSPLTSTLTSTKLYVKLKNLTKLLVALKSLCTLNLIYKTICIIPK